MKKIWSRIYKCVCIFAKNDATVFFINRSDTRNLHTEGVQYALHLIVNLMQRKGKFFPHLTQQCRLCVSRGQTDVVIGMMITACM